MKKKHSILILFLSFVSIGLFAQNKFENKQVGISFFVPSTWNKIQDKQLYHEFEGLEMNEENLAEFIKKNNGKVQLVSYNKYNRGSSVKTKINPTIFVSVKLNNTENSKDFYEKIVENSEKNKCYFSNVDYSIEPTEIEISGMKAIYYVGDYTIPRNKRKELVFERRNYIIPSGKYYVEIEFTDGTNDETNSAIFDKIIQSIKIDI